MNPKNWSVTSYTNSTDTTLVDEASIITTIIAANTSGNTVEFSISLNGTVIVPPHELEENETKTLYMRSVVIQEGQELTVQADGAGVHFLASGIA